MPAVRTTNQTKKRNHTVASAASTRVHRQQNTPRNYNDTPKIDSRPVVYYATSYDDAPSRLSRRVGGFASLLLFTHHREGLRIDQPSYNSQHLLSIHPCPLFLFFSIFHHFLQTSSGPWS